MSKPEKYEFQNIKINKLKSGKWIIYFKVKNLWGKRTEEYRKKAIEINDTQWLIKHHEYDFKQICICNSKKEVIEFLSTFIDDSVEINKKLKEQI